MKVKPVTKKELVRSVYFSTDKKGKDRLSLYILEDVFDCFIDAVGEAMVRGETVYIRGLGAFHPIKYGYSVYRNVWNPGKGKLETQTKFINSKVFTCAVSLFKRINLEDRDVFKNYFNDNTSIKL